MLETQPLLLAHKPAVGARGMILVLLEEMIAARHSLAERFRVFRPFADVVA